jgi:2-polyprenyl-3-methyl-5-hydroxy-6-metoxy-1,4-benzoquinol methylase
MARQKKVDSKEVGLEIELLIFKFFLKTEYLHYGMFTPDIEIDITNLGKAQQKYAEFLFSNIPDGVKTILDVGCGSGKTAKELMARGYTVDAVSPGVWLTEYARKLTEGRADIFQSKFEDLNIDRKYDLVLFSESFQYIPMDVSLKKARTLLNSNGHIMICDFFKTDPEKTSLLGGGHEYDKWIKVLKKEPVQVIKEQDITRETSYTIDLVNALSKEVLHPVFNLGFMLGEDRFPLVMKLVKWKYKKKLEKMQRKHFSGERSGENFRRYKKYMFYLLKV